MTVFDLDKEYNRYVQDVLDRKIVACKAIRQACRRFRDWYDRDDIYFDYTDVDKKIEFIHKLRHFTGQFSDQPFVLMSWQQFVVAGIFGFKWVSNDKRVTKKALLFISRKNGKSCLAAALSLLMSVSDNEKGAEVNLVANSARQAYLTFDKVQRYSRSIDPIGKIFNRYRSDIRIPHNGSVIQIHSSDATKLDGLNSSCSIIDEFEEAKDWKMYNVLMSSTGMRQQPLTIVTTTAGYLVGQQYPLYNMYRVCKDILGGLKVDDTQFAAIYELDEEDKWDDEKVWIKASPSLGTTVTYDFMREQCNDAKNNVSLEVGFKTKNLNKFCSSLETWIKYEYIQDVMKPVNIEDLRDEVSFGGADLSAVCDLTAHAICVPPNADRSFEPDKFIFKVWIYIPQQALSDSPNREIYKEWLRNGWAKVTSGNVVDYDTILADQLKVADIVSFQTYGYDTYNATQWAINATNEGLPLRPFSQSLPNYNKPTKFLEILIRSKKCVIDSSPALAAMFDNTELKIGSHNNVMPVKANGNDNNKIDGVVAMIEALGCYLSSKYYVPEAWVIS